jgi:glutathione peroxidase
VWNAFPPNLHLSAAQKEIDMTDVYEIEVTNIQGEKTSLAPYRGKLMLIVNVASKCGFTSQYDGLEELHKKYGDRGLAVLGFPCNQFGNQEPGTEEQIMEFCRLNHGVTFPLFAKIEVNGKNAHPLFVYLKSQRPGLLGSEAIKWNFTKFLVDRDGEVVARFPPSTTPAAIGEEISSRLQT